MLTVFISIGYLVSEISENICLTSAKCCKILQMISMIFCTSVFNSIEEKDKTISGRKGQIMFNGNYDTRRNSLPTFRTF